jgi:hypothetical protein
MREEVIFVQNLAEEDKQMLLQGIMNIEEILEKEQGILTFDRYSPERMYPFQIMSEGNFGILFRYKHFVIKYIKEHSWEEEELEHEASIYLKLQELDEAPQLYAYSDNFIIMEFIEGYQLHEGFVPNDVDGIRTQIELVSEAILDKGYIPYDVEFFITVEGKLKIIDVGLFQSFEDVSQKENHLKSVCQLWDSYLGVKKSMIG